MPIPHQVRDGLCANTLSALALGTADHALVDQAVDLIPGVAELAEHFQWMTPEESENLPPEKREQVSEELADVLLYVVRLADKLDIDLLEAARNKLEENALFWRKTLIELGFVIKKGDSPIVPVMLFNAKLSQDIARDLYALGVYVIGFFFPVVPAGQARIRTQLSADLEIPQPERAAEAFKTVGEKYGILGLDKKGIIAKYGL